MKYISILLLSLIGFSTNAVNPKDNSLLAAPPIEVGDEAPEIILKNPDGKTVKLSSLRGKMVLIDFWASWCGPCRRENPNVVRAYDKYSKAKFKHAKGFEVFSISLDNNVNAWKGAIEKDNLHWDAHGSDLKKWRSDPVKIYGVGSIPSSFLVNAKGVVIAKNLRGKMIDMELDKYVTKM